MSNEDKIFTGLKLQDQFLNSDVLDFILSQDNGAEYWSLYLLLCKSAVNSGGVLATKLGDKDIPYTAQKIARDCKYFPIDTVNLALVLFKQLGLIEERDDGILQIANFDDMVCFESGSTARVRRHRQKVATTKTLQCNNDVTQTALQERYTSVTPALQCNNDVTQTALQKRYTSVTSTLHERYTGVTEKKEKVGQKENKDFDRQTDCSSDDFTKNNKESYSAGARTHEGVENSNSIAKSTYAEYSEDKNAAYEANQEAYQAYQEALDVMAEDVHSNSDAERQQEVVNVLRYIGGQVVNATAVTIHGEKIPTTTFLQTLTKAIEAGKDGALQATIHCVAAAMLDGKVKNQAAYLISTLYTRLCAGIGVKVPPKEEVPQPYHAW